MKTLKTTLIILSSLFITSCQKKENNNKQYTIDYKGKELSQDEIKQLFTYELKKYDSAITKNGKIILVNNFPSIKKQPAIKIKDFLGKRYSNFKSSIKQLNESDFLLYYNSLNDTDKYSFITSYFLRKKLPIIKSSSSIKNFLRIEFNEFEKKENYNLKNYNQVNKLEFLIENHNTDIEKEIVDYFSKIKKGNYNYKNSNFIYSLSKINKAKALEIFKQLVNFQNSYVKNEPREKVISLTNIELATSFILAKDSNKQDEFIELSIKLLELDLYNYNNISSLIHTIWNSQKLDNSQRMRFIKSLEKSSDKTLLILSKELKINSLGINYLKNINVKRDSITTNDLVFISLTNLTKKEKNLLLNYIKINEKELKYNSQRNYGRGLYRINENLNSNTKLDYYIEQFKKVGYDVTLDYDSLRSKLLLDYPTGSIWKTEFPQFFLNREFISSFTADIVFDTESGEFPNNYPELINKFGFALKKYHNIVIESSQIVNFTKSNKEIKSYEVYINSIQSDKIYKIIIPDTGDWFACKSIIDTLNLILIDNKKEERFIPINTGDQLSRYLLMEPASYLILDEKLSFNVKQLE